MKMSVTKFFPWEDVNSVIFANSVSQLCFERYGFSPAYFRHNSAVGCEWEFMSYTDDVEEVLKIVSVVESLS